jgi:FtsP/CotA-like multicopper oxidase with cupredoxin domain
MLYKVHFILYAYIIILNCVNHISAVKRYDWFVHYIKYNPDGFFRTVIAIDNGTGFCFPGPLLRVQRDEWVQVIVHNELPTEAISIHWHGLHQTNTPWMDGVQQVTQFPILPTTSFNYTFKADKVGTHWYHSHTGGQYTDGLFGPLVVDDPDDPYKNITNEHIVMISEWYHKNVIDTFDIFTKHLSAGSQFHPFATFVSGLYNGKGRFDCNVGSLDSDECWQNSTLQRFLVTPNKIYRFRLISAGSQYNYLFSIDNHNLTIIAIDGIYVEPYTVQRIYIDIGQRYDVLLKMDQPVDNYWIRTITDNNRQRAANEFNAILQYEGASPVHDPTSAAKAPGIFLTDSAPLVPSVYNSFADPHVSLKPPNFTVMQEFNLSCNEPTIDYCWINHHRYRLPRYPTLLNMYQKISPSSYYNSTHIVDLNYGDRVMMIINNFVNISHPLHLHGHDFYVLGRGSDNPYGNPILFNESEHSSVLNLINPPIRDTAKLPQRSWLVIGFIATNPGSWIFHCHIAFDMEAGMGFIFHVNGGNIPSPPSSYLITDEYNKFIKADASRSLINDLTVLFLHLCLHSILFFF